MSPVAVTRSSDALLAAGDEHRSGPSVSFASPRRSLRGHGIAEIIELPAPWPDHVGRVAEALSRYDVTDDLGAPGSGPVAFGALPFDRATHATLIVPVELHGHTAEGTRWTTTITSDATEAATVRAHARGHAVAHTPDPFRDPGTVSVRATRSSEDWCASVRDATQRIQRGELTKVVLARELEVRAAAPFDAEELAARLASMHPGALRFCIDGFVGASPELLVSRVGDVVRAHPMAGTTVRTGTPEDDQRRAAELLASDKNRVEHQITIDMVHDTLLPWCSYLDAEPSPTVVQAGPVQHLATLVEGRLSQPAPSVLELVAALHPTPAVGGWPRAEALRAISELEHADRGRYAGPVGWVDAQGNGAWAVGIRSADLDGSTARVFAGVGVVADSDPAAELAETRAKAQALLGALVRP